jgi:hypothetical protein
MSDKEPMTTEQAVTLWRSAETAYEPEVFKPNLTWESGDANFTRCWRHRAALPC